MAPSVDKLLYHNYCQQKPGHLLRNQRQRGLLEAIAGSTLGQWRRQEIITGWILSPQYGERGSASL